MKMMTEKTGSGTKNIGVCFLRVFFCFMVVCFHFHANWTTYPRPYIFLRELAVPVFVVIAFFFGTKTICVNIADEASQKAAHEKQRRRIVRMFVPYLLWGVIGFCYVLIFGNLLRLNEPVTAQDFIWQMLTGCVENVDPPLWYLWMMLAMTVGCMVLYAICGGWRYSGDGSDHTANAGATLIILAVASIACLILQYNGMNFAFFDRFRYELKHLFGRVVEILPLVTIGLILGITQLPQKCKAHGKKVTVPLFIFLIWLIGWHDYIFPYPPKHFAYAGLANIIVAPLIVIVAYGIPFEKLPKPVCAAIDFASRHTMGIFCMHWFVGRTINTLWLRTFGVEKTLTECFVIFAFCFVISVLIGKLPFKTAKMLVE